MKVKFYKGPYHNKTREVRDHERAIVIASALPHATLADYYDTTTEFTVGRHVYYRTNHTHPDGSVFFVYGGKS